MRLVPTFAILAFGCWFIGIFAQDAGAQGDFPSVWLLERVSSEAAQEGAHAPVLGSSLRPPPKRTQLPQTRWQHRNGHGRWTRGALRALQEHGQPLVAFVPRDIATWCAAYEAAPAVKRRAFWVGFLSSLAKYESTYREAAVGGGNRWFGLLQIAPSTARGYDCRARTGAALQDGAENLSCAIRILARTVPRDGVIHGYAGGKGLGVTADWAPMHKRVKRAEMASWLQAQSYCQSPATVRPRGRVLVD